MNVLRSLNRSAVLSLVCTLAAFMVAAATRADIPPDQLKAAGAIPLTTDLLSKMEKFVNEMTSNTDAKAEMAAIGNDPSNNPDNMGGLIGTKCPKTVAVLKASGLTPDEFVKAIFAMMALAMSEEFGKTDDQNAKANADFFAANKDRCNAVFGGFLALSMPADPSSSPASTP